MYTHIHSSHCTLMDTRTHLQCMGSSHLKFNVLCFYPKSNPYHIITVVFFPLQCSVFSAAYEWEVVHPCVWRAPEVHEGKDQCWWQGPPGAGEHGVGQPSAVDEKTDDGECFRISDCCHFTGGWIVSFSVRAHTAMFRLGARFPVKNKPPTSVFCHIYSEDR